MIIRIDASEWHQEYLDRELDVSTTQKLIDLATETDIATPELTRLVIVGRERGETDGEILPPNKNLLQSGGTHALNLMFARRVQEIKTASGKPFKVRELVAPVTEFSDDDSQIEDETQPARATFAAEWGLAGEHDVKAANPHLALFDSHEAGDRALRYLLQRVPGYIWGRLCIIYASGGDVRAAADELKAKIDEMMIDLDDE